MTTHSNLRQLPDAELLRMILGEESAARIAHRPLIEIFRLLSMHSQREEAESCPSLRPLQAAKELLVKQRAKLSRFLG